MRDPVLKLTSEEVEKLLAASTDAIIVVASDGTIVIANSSAEELFGYAAKEMIGQGVEVLVPDAARSRHRQHRHRYKGKPHSRPLVSGLNLRGRRKDGSIFAAEIALTPVDGSNGKLVATTIRDLSAGDTSEAYFRQLLESAPDAMIIVDNHGRIAIVNEQSEKMFGYSRDNLVGQHIEDLLPARYRERHIEHRRRYLEDPRVRPMGIDMELFARRADGSEFPVEISLSPVVSTSGTFVSSVIRDVTRRKQMESELIDARKEAERAHKANTAFLAAASHDLRQPVQALSLLTGALRRTIKDPLAKEMVEGQQYSLDAMTNLLNSLLDISRLDAGAIKPEVVDFPVRRLFDRLSAESARQAAQKGLAFTAETDGSIVRSDPNLLGEIVQNLVSNAIRYTEEGHVTLDCHRIGGRLSIDVRDTGIGIAQEHVEEIFCEFHQLRTPGRDTEGFGLGLAIVRRLSDLLGLEVVVASTPGKGSCFSVIVPIVDQKAEVIAQAMPAEEVVNSTAGVILLVEDDRRVARAWELLLRAEGYSVLSADSADEAVAVVKVLMGPPHLIISDFHLLGRSNGVQAVTRVRSVFDSEIPAFVVSGDTTKVTDEAKRLTNSVLLSKPVDTEELLAGAREAIATGQASQR